MARPLRAEIDLAALCRNYRTASALAPQSRSMAVLKADAYGHGALACARALTGLAPAFAVATIEEAVALRDGGIETPIMLLEGIFEAAELATVEALSLWQVVHSEWQLEAVLAYRPRRPLPVWLKFDAGMHRLGFSADELRRHWARLRQAPERVTDLHLISHFSTADLADDSAFQAQHAQVRALGEALGAPLCLANSPATLQHPPAHGAWNRPGVMLYGSNPLEGALPAGVALEPVMTLRSRLIAVRTLEAGEAVGYGGRFRTRRHSRIGVVAAGYGDGYDRHARDGTPVLVNGQRCAIAGRVSMDMLTVDITEVADADVGSEVVLWGRGLGVDEVAGHCDTIAYTLLTGVLPRAPRVYLPATAAAAVS
ncbi:alanine racemase [Salinicola endophyticus]|uniref:Alanine racemase n=1 Tax=Salinicola endophyticus TaxID=1949083 RepID=A0AB74U9Z4_9GAMM